jgi:hypothetical protein
VDGLGGEVTEIMAETNSVTCASCGNTNPAGMRFCGFCGGALTPPAQKGVATNAPEEAAPVATSVATTVSVTPIVIGGATAAPPPIVPPSPESAPATVLSVPAAASPTVEPVLAVKPAEALPPAETPGPVAPAKPEIPIPADPIAREVERDKLQTLAGVQRARGQITDARVTLERVLLLSEGLAAREVAPVHEQIGDLLLVEMKLEEAAAAFAKAHEVDPARVSAEKKFANTTLRIADSKAEGNMSAALLRGDSIGDLLAESSRYGRRNAGVAMLLSLVPGFGQFYNGQFVKGAVLLGIFAVALLIISISPDRDELVRNFALTMALKPTSGGAVSPLTVTMAIMAFGAALYSLVDAPYYAGKVNTSDVPDGPADKSGWEV